MDTAGDEENGKGFGIPSHPNNSNLPQRDRSHCQANVRKFLFFLMCIVKLNIAVISWALKLTRAAPLVQLRTQVYLISSIESK